MLGDYIDDILWVATIILVLFLSLRFIKNLFTPNTKQIQRGNTQLNKSNRSVSFVFAGLIISIIIGLLIQFQNMNIGGGSTSKYENTGLYIIGGSLSASFVWILYSYLLYSRNRHSLAARFLTIFTLITGILFAFMFLYILFYVKSVGYGAIFSEDIDPYSSLQYQNLDLFAYSATLFLGCLGAYLSRRK